MGPRHWQVCMTWGAQVLALEESALPGHKCSERVSQETCQSKQVPRSTVYLLALVKGI